MNVVTAHGTVGQEEGQGTCKGASINSGVK